MRSYGNFTIMVGLALAVTGLTSWLCLGALRFCRRTEAPLDALF